MSYITGVLCALGHLLNEYVIFALALTMLWWLIVSQIYGKKT